MRKFLLWLIVVGSLMTMSMWVASRVLEPTPAGVARAPIPEDFTDAVVQVYGADVWGFRGNFAIHTWVATKAKNASTYRIYQVIGWRQRRGQDVVSITTGMPDTPWFRSPPILLHERIGVEAESLVDAIHSAALSYPHAESYTMWPGPNSNSFTAWIALEVPELGLSLPTKAVGKSWMIETYPSLISP